MLLEDGGPHRFFAPLLDDRRDLSHLPLLLYLPGIDGTGMAASPQFKELSSIFEISCLGVPASSRASLASSLPSSNPVTALSSLLKCQDDLAASVEDYMRPIAETGRPIYLFGESLGGMLALYVTLRCPSLIHKVILVNPATSYDRTFWPTVAPMLTQLPEEAAVPLALMPLLASPVGMTQNALNIAAASVASNIAASRGVPLAEQLSNARDTMDGVREQLLLSLSEIQLLARIIPRDTLAFRLGLLGAGCAEVNARLGEISTPVFIFTGGADLLVQSGSEGPRLASQLANATLDVVPLGSHMLLQEGNSLKEALLRSSFYSPTPVSTLDRVDRKGSWANGGSSGSSAGSAAGSVVGSGRAPSAAAAVPVAMAVAVGAVAAAAVPAAASTSEWEGAAGAAAGSRAEAGEPAGSGAASATEERGTSGGSSEGAGPSSGASTTGSPGGSSGSANGGSHGNGNGNGSSAAPMAAGGGGGGSSGSGKGKRGPREIKLGKDALPTPEQRKRVDNALRVTRRLSSPVFFSTRADGKVVEGLSALPVGQGPVLLVGNHQTLAFDLGVLIDEVLRETGVLMRGLAHPLAFQMMDRAEKDEGPVQAQGQFMLAEQQKRQQRRNSPAPDADDAGGDFFASMGAVPVSGKNLYKLLQAGETALLFPGGVREAYKRKGEKYQLFWPARPEFVRMAIKFGATIVPFSAVGLEDSFDIVVDSKELLGAPVIGGMVRERISGLPTARPVGGGAALVSEEIGDLAEQFVSPIVVPRAPARMYFRFGKPIYTAGRKEELSEKAAAKELYDDIRNDVEGGIQYLLKKREEDPFKDLSWRLLFEGAWRGRRAPTFRP